MKIREYFTEEQDKLLEQSIKIYGIDTNKLIFIEELAEITKAYIKLLRADKKTDSEFTYRRLLRELTEECADCLVMCQTFKIVNGLEFWDNPECLENHEDKIDTLFYFSAMMSELRISMIWGQYRLNILLGFSIVLTNFIDSLNISNEVKAISDAKIERLRKRIKRTEQERRSDEKLL